MTEVVKCKWTDERLTILLNELINEHRSGTGTSSGFKSASWARITINFNRAANVSYKKDQLQSQYAILKKKYAVFEQLRGTSGFGWDDATKTVTAPDTVWDAYIAGHKGIVHSAFSL